MVQVENLRSNNSKNALTLVYEIFSVRPEVKKVSESFINFSRVVLPAVLNRTLADKNFIASLAKKGITTAAEQCPTYPVCNILLEGTRSKALALAEFSLQSLSILVRCSDKSFFNDPSSDCLILTMCDIIEGKKSRMVKNATPVLLEFK